MWIWRSGLILVRIGENAVQRKPGLGRGFTMTEI